MKIWLDDERPPPNSDWVVCRWPEEVIAHLKTGKVTVLSLDHDLGEGSEYVSPRTGMKVLDWLEREVFVNNMKPPRRIRVHSRNDIAAQTMRVIAKRIRMKAREGEQNA